VPTHLDEDKESHPPRGAKDGLPAGIENYLSVSAFPQIQFAIEKVSKGVPPVRSGFDVEDSLDLTKGHIGGLL
jgi:hypothetical protein